METRHLTIMFTDMKGFTSRTSVRTREQLEYLINLQDTLLRPIFKEFNGKVVKTIGDAFMVIFDSPTDAVLCGMKIQEKLDKHNKQVGEEERMEVRVAINSGEANIKEGDVFGEPVNIASRIENIAEAGEVYFTESVYLTMNKNEIPSAEVGIRHLKGIPDDIKVYKVLREEKEAEEAKTRRKKLAEIAGRIPKDGSSIAIRDEKEHGIRKTIFIILIIIGSLIILFIVMSFFKARRLRQDIGVPREKIEKFIEQRAKDRLLPLSKEIKDREPRR